MRRIFRSIGSGIAGLFGILFNGGRYGGPIRTDKSAEYAKRQEQRKKDFAEFGGHPCKICGTRIPANKYYCAPCYFEYKKK